MEMDKNPVSITFDENSQIRVLDSDKYKDTENLKTECLNFLKTITNFNDLVTNIVDVLNLYSLRIEDEKLRAVGIRNRIENEEENRKRKQQELEIQINEKKVELERLHSQSESLLKVETEQRLFIEKFSNNEI